MPTKIILFALALFFSPLVFSQLNEDESVQVPPDFGKAGEILVVNVNSPMLTDKKNDKLLETAEEVFGKNYTGKITIYDKKPGSYADTSKYRYMFVVFVEYSPATTIGRDRFPASTDYSFGVIDMVTQKTYRQLRFGAYKKLMGLYVKKLEAMRKKNSG